MAGMLIAMLLLIPLSVPPAGASEGELTLILVSDNEADAALAAYLANLTGYVVIKTPWGIYDPNVTAKVIGYAPDRVIIIGGPDAVSDEYEADLRSLGIPVERWGGLNRYETNIISLKNAKLKLKLNFAENLIISPGNDSVAIQKALQLSIEERGILLFVNASSNLSDIGELLGIRSFRLTLVISPVTERIVMKISSQIPGGATTAVNITSKDAREAIERAEEALERAENATANLNQSPDAIGSGRYESIDRFLDRARTALIHAKDAYEAGEYKKAYELALISKGQSEMAIKLASLSLDEKLKLDPEFRYSFLLLRYQAQEGILERAGVNTTRLHELILQLKDAISKGEYDVVPSLIAQIQNELRKLFMEGKPFIRERIYFPLEHGGGLGEP